MKSKTLKDLNGILKNGKVYVNFDNLEQEAIKCIDSNSIKHMNANDFILWFFNITEEDLK